MKLKKRGYTDRMINLDKLKMIYGNTFKQWEDGRDDLLYAFNNKSYIFIYNNTSVVMLNNRNIIQVDRDIVVNTDNFSRKVYLTSITTKNEVHVELLSIYRAGNYMIGLGGTKLNELIVMDEGINHIARYDMGGNIQVRVDGNISILVINSNTLHRHEYNIDIKKDRIEICSIGDKILVPFKKNKLKVK